MHDFHKIFQIIWSPFFMEIDFVPSFKDEHPQNLSRQKGLTGAMLDFHGHFPDLFSLFC